ncbi:MAG: hypothetical protein ACRD2P_06315 [Terriglobia bacterium]
MANIALQIGADSLSTAHLTSKDFSKTAQDLKFIFDGRLTALLNQPLSSVPHGSCCGMKLDAGNPSWTLAGTPATFSLKSKASAAITIHSPAKAPLFTYYKDFGNREPASCPGKPDSIYVITEFQFNITGSLAANASTGNIGVTTDDDGSASYTVRNYKAFPGSTILRDALAGAVAAFTLPLHLNTLNNLEDGDCIYYELDGALNVCFGMTYGIDASVGGYSLSEIDAVFEKLSKIFNISSPQIFTVSATVGPSVKFNWRRRFQCFLERSKPDPGKAGTATLHLSPGTTSQRGLQLSADAGISQISPPELSVNAGTLIQWILQKAYGSANPQPGEAIQTLLDQLQKEVPKYISDANQWLLGLFQKFGTQGEITLALLFQNTTGFLSAFTWNFDLTNGAFPQAWQDAVSGDFLGATETGAVTLDPGSGFENVHYNSTKLTLTLFGLTYFQQIDTYFARSTVRYAGNGQFFLETDTGKVATTLDFGSKSSTVIYLEGNAQGADDSGSIEASKIQIRLHGILSSASDRTQTARLGALLGALGSLLPPNGVGADVTSAGALFGNFSSRPGVTSLHLICEASALQRLPSDAANWSAYAWASDKLPSDPAAFLTKWLGGNPSGGFYKDYSSWAAFNRLTNGYTDSEGNPDPNQETNRQSYGDCQSSMLMNYFGDGLSNIDANQLGLYFSAGQQYMNLCADLDATLHRLDPSTTADWGSLTARLAQVAQADVDPWFGPTVLLALAMSCQPIHITVLNKKFVPTDYSGAMTVGIS